MGKETTRFYSEDRMNEIKLANWVTTQFNNAKSNKAPREALNKKCLEAYNKVYDDKAGKPDWASKHTSNFIKATIETIRPIMTDNNPRFQALAKTEKGIEYADKIQMMLDHEWDREEMSVKLPKIILTALQTGTGIVYIPWDKNDDKGKGNTKIIPVDPKKIFPDPMATSFEDANYIIYADWLHEKAVIDMFPDRKDDIMSQSVLADSELITQPMYTPQANMVLVLEMWLRDSTFIDVEDIDEYGNIVVKKKKKYPRGRVINILPHSGVVLSDRHNPYIDGKFPFVAFKDYDIPFEFWGAGDIEHLLSPQESIDILNNAILDNAKHVANTVWIIDKNAGIPKGALKNREGLVIRKNPGTEVSRPAPPPMPSYVGNTVEILKNDIETISGVHDVTQGKNVSGITAAQAIMALQEAGQARVRLKVKIMELALGKVGDMVLSRNKQFWTDERMVRVVGEDGNVQNSKITTDILGEKYDIKVVAGSTMPMNKNALLDMMIRLTQTPAEDGMPMIDREALMQFVPIVGKQKMLERIKQAKQGAEQQAIQQMTEQQQQLMEVIKELSSEVEKLSKEHARMKEEKAKREQFEKGYEAGQNGKDLTNDEKYGIIQGDKKIPDEILEMIQDLSDSEMQQLLQAVPNLSEILESNL